MGGAGPAVSRSYPEGRGAGSNPRNRFETIALEMDWEALDDGWQDLMPAPKTQYLRDTTKTIISYNDAPDIPFRASINPYRGCEHGCIYCYARTYHEYLGFSAGLDFESKIIVKEDAPKLLSKELSSRTWQPQIIAMSGVTDIYQPVERRLKITRGCLEVLAAHRNPVGMITKNGLIVRDIDVLAELARHQAVSVLVSVTSLDESLWRVMEPRTSCPTKRLDAIAKLNAAGIPAGVMVGPVIPGLTDDELPAILKAAGEAGARFATYTVLRLPYGVGALFEQWLDEYFPERKKKIMDRVYAVHQGTPNTGAPDSRMRGAGAIADQIEFLFRMGCEKAGITNDRKPLSIESFRRDPKIRELFG
ncbi:MAG: PA0069 family radical SAM protein [Planctomycetes bacterium]|nr:PA0069 family radical SAM protein [Planctomycetota bacterium]NUQ34416.1 PA0069 family radical SAM protein [Planctomycetaceae bacterium]